MSLAKPDSDEKWVYSFRNPRADRFAEQALHFVMRTVNAPRDSTFLDAGCGPCAQTLRLARLGYFVKAVDFSESVLKIATANVKASGLESRISIRRGDLRMLPFESEAFDYALCWGVLMHVPEVHKAIAELSRVLKPRGVLIVAERSMHSLDSGFFRNVRRFRRKGETRVTKTATGLEFWSMTPAGPLRVRHANIPKLIEAFRSNGLVLKKCLAGEFTNAYERVSSRYLKDLIQGFNLFWLRRLQVPQFASGNILIYSKDR